MSEPRDHIVRRKLADEVHDRLLALIERGELAPGAEVPSERELMDRFGVGRPAVREALQALEKTGLIAIHHGRHARVVRPDADALLRPMEPLARHLLSTSPTSLEDLKAARLFFETGLAREAAARATDADIERLNAALDRQRALFGTDAEAFVEADLEFHAAIAAIAGNPILAAVSRAMLGWLREFHARILHWKGNEHVTLDEHGRIVAAIAARDGAAAFDLMADHLNRTKAAYNRAHLQRAG